ncbi:hypothetical protein JDW15_00500 [Aerococcaceae bacterium zg-ZJ1578]|uniref:glycosyl hydrolase n=1 Tax=Aerococcaceae bacterium zg-252 TaxID=2796928 RepID=UPI001A1EF00A|nr:hypothetical protein [Aerococcaceae bacterium zg-1578]
MKKFNNHLYPFFWQHGECEDTLVEYVEKIYQSGIKGVCVESRPHPEFVGEQWWRDLGIIIRECEKRGMQIWVLDDSHFPTGFANGKIKEEYPELKKQYLSMRRFDVVGPMKGARIDASQLKGKPWINKQVNIFDVIGVYLAERATEYNQVDDPIIADTLVDITAQFSNQNTITLDIPKGNWSVFVVFSTDEGGEDSTKDYLNPLVKEATQVLVNEVYESHYEHFGHAFGKTITAFFSDEPRFGNMKGTQAWLGQIETVLPWRPGMENELEFESKLLPLLWVPSVELTEREIRFEYMDFITKEYNHNFTKILADWCEEHGVYYTGHNIEDNGAHARLGYGVGHFFRGQEAQHISGIDVIGGQVVPGMPYHHDAYQSGGSDGQFYHFALAKLGSSAAYLYSHKQGRAMCEAFGAYGWNEGLKTMKWIADHLIVRGINLIVPHAFSPKAYPDFDCPPHFYAHGNNPQFRYMPKLTQYMNRLMTIFSDGKPIAPVGIFYPAELEWVSRDYMSIEIPARVLTENQIDFMIISNDLIKVASVNNGALVINGHSFKTLLMPYGSYYPQSIIRDINRLIAQGLDVIFIDKLPENHQFIGGEKQVVPLNQLDEILSNRAEIKLSHKAKELVYYHYQKEGKDYWLFFNESICDTLDVEIDILGERRVPIAYDAYEDKYYPVNENRIVLEPYQTIVWIVGEDKIDTDEVKPNLIENELKLNWKVSLADAKQYPTFTPVMEMEEFVPINTIQEYECFAGTVCYEATLELESVTDIYGLNLGKAYEITEVWINGQALGTKIAPPYVYCTNEVWREGENTIRIEVTNTLGTMHRGGLNQYLLIEPFGLTESVKILKQVART